MQTVHSVLIKVTLNEAVRRWQLTLKAWLTAESSMGQSILPLTLTVPTKKSCCLTSCWHRVQQTGDIRTFVMFYWSDKGKTTKTAYLHL